MLRAHCTMVHPPADNSTSLMDPHKDIVYAHMGKILFRDALKLIVAPLLDLNHCIHWTGLFFPWHRWYLHANLPTDAAHFYESAFFKESDPKSGLDGWGDTSTQFRVLDGGFSAFSSFWLLYPFPHMLHQKFNLFPRVEQVLPVPGLAYNHTCPANASFIKPVVESLIDGFVGDFKGFQARMEGGPHINVHFIVGRDVGGLCPSDTPVGYISGPTFTANGSVTSLIIRPLLIASPLLDPLFWLNHAMVNCIWFKWQKKHKLNTYAFEGGSVQQFENTTVFSQYLNEGPPYLTSPLAPLRPPTPLTTFIQSTPGLVPLLV
ncbi:Di-copper centre-containing protein [Mycena leptocephala]|nr:Di-copper centre-containing protein [Mycena leptocephala]